MKLEQKLTVIDGFGAKIMEILREFNETQLLSRKAKPSFPRFPFQLILRRYVLHISED